jgi:hypothetical protein
MGNYASGGWEKCMAGEHLHNTNLFLITLKNGKFSLKFLPDGQKFRVLGC